MAPAGPSSNGLSLDAVLTNYIGEFGVGQKKLLLYSSLIWIPQCCLILLMVFTNKDSIKDKNWKCVDAQDTACADVYARPSLKDFCGLSASQWEWQDKKTSIIADFNLVCDKAVFSQLVNSAFFLGYLIGGGLFGSMADQRGRRWTLLVSMITGTAGVLMSGFSPDYWVYFISRILTGVGAAGQSLVTYLLATETVGPSWRGLAGVITQMFFIVGEFVLVLIAWLIQPWRALCFSIAIMSGAAGVLLLKIPESPRWLLAKGRKAEALSILEQLATDNGTRMPLDSLSDPLPAGAGGVNQQHKMSLGNVLRDRHICRRFVVLAYVWCILCMTYYGISLALSGLQGSFYLTFAISAAAEIPSNVLGAWMIERIGRHNSLAAGMLLGGVACLICSFCPPGIGQAICAAIGKLGCAGAFTIASIYTSELFPTLVRSAVLGLENEAARVGGIAAPFIVLLGTQISSSMPFLVFGVTSVFAGLLIFTLPETLGAPMPDTMRDMENIQSIFTTKAWTKGWKETRNQLFSTHAASTQSLDGLTAIREDEHGSHSAKPHGGANGDGDAAPGSTKAKSGGLDGGYGSPPPHDAISVAHDKHVHSGVVQRRSSSGAHRQGSGEQPAHHHSHHQHHAADEHGDEQSALLGAARANNASHHHK